MTLVNINDSKNIRCVGEKSGRFLILTPDFILINRRESEEDISDVIISNYDIEDETGDRCIDVDIICDETREFMNDVLEHIIINDVSCYLETIENIEIF